MAPLCIQVFDAHTAQLVPMEESPAAAALQAHTPFTACCLSKDPVANPSNNISEQYMAVGSQDGTVLVFSLTRGTIHGPLHEFHVGTGDPQDDCRAGVGSLAMSITVVHFDSKSLVYAGSVGHCRCWNLETGALWREFPLPSTSSDSGSDRDVAPSSLVTTRRQLETGEVMLLWVGLDNGNIAVFDVESGMLVRSFLCAGPEAVVALAAFVPERFVFALSAHRRVSVWDLDSYEFVQKHPAELITCGSDLSAMVSVETRSQNMSLLLAAGVDGSLCIRRVSRRNDGKPNCVLLSYLDAVSGEMGCPITSINYHLETDSVLIGNAGCSVSLLSTLQDQLGEVPLPTGHTRVSNGTDSQSPTTSSPGAQRQIGHGHPQSEQASRTDAASAGNEEAPVEVVVETPPNTSDGCHGTNPPTEGSSGNANFPIFQGD